MNPKTLQTSVVAENLPTRYGVVGTAPGVEFGAPMFVTAEGDIYLGTAGRGLLLLKKGK